MDLATSSYLATAALHSALALAAWQRRSFSEGWAGRTFGAAVAATAGWGWSAALGGVLQRPGTALWFAAGFDFLRYALWLAFLLQLLQAAASNRRSFGVTGLVRATAGLLAAALVLSILRATQPAGGVLTRLGAAGVLSLPVLGLVLTEQLYRNVVDDARWSVKPLCLGLGLLFVFDIYFFSEAALFDRFDPDAVRIRGAIHALSAPLLFVALGRQSHRGGQLRISRSAAFQTATLLLVGIYLLFISGIGYYVRRFGGDWGSALQLALVFAASVALLVMLLSGTLRARFRVLLEKNFFAYRYDYRTEWLRLTSILASSTTPEDVGVSVVRGLADIVESPAGALWFRAAGDAELVQTARWNMPRSEYREPADSPLCTFLADKGWIVDIDECVAAPRAYDGLAIPDGLQAVAARWLLVPLGVAEQLTGFVVLAQPRSPQPVNWEVRDLLKTASRQAAAFLAQIHAAEALLEAKKFMAFNKMSAFVVHDLKNIVAQLSLMLKNARRLGDNPEFQQDMLATVENSLDKMRQLMLQLREGEVPASGTSGVDLLPVARRIAESARQRGRTVELRLGEAVATRGSEDRIERVLGHVVQNALDATTPAERVWLEVVRSGGQVKVVVGDTGLGMSEEFVRTRLFKPFATTKSGGMGIGAYESFQYLKELGGSIEVESAPQRGTIVTMRLPLLETRPRTEASSVP